MSRPSLSPLWPVGLPAALVATGGAALLYGTHVERHYPRLREVEVTISGLPAAFDGYRIVQLSDFHVGGRGWSPDLMRRAADLALAQRGDLIALTGDFVENRAGIAAWGALFRALRAPDGVLAVLGNHDYSDHGVRVEALIAALSEQGIRVLRNECHRVRRDGQELWLVGVDDPYSGHDYLPKAVAGVPSEARPILLVHYPDFTWRLPPHRWALALCGHAHGSQVGLPLVGWYLRQRIARTRFSHGLYRVNHIPVFVTTGVGTSGRPVRLLARPEVVVIRLRAAAGEVAA
jgi:predicted MPP superfamily phosphohydrolase